MYYQPYNSNSMMQNRFYNPYDIPFVNGKQSAEAYTMPPNSKIILMDRELPRFYLKQTDASGCYTVSTYEFKEIKEEPVNVNTGDFISRKEFEELKAMIYESYSKFNDPITSNVSVQSTADAKPVKSKPVDLPEF